MKKVTAESYSFNALPERHNLDDPFLSTGIDLEPEVHPRSEIQLNAAHRLVAALGLKRKKSKASIMPSNQASDTDTHISSTEE